jgi:energy-coupling factor transport system permease protein
VKGSIQARIRSVLPLIVPLFISTFRKANELALAMDARCYRSGKKRSSFYVLKFNTRDYFAIAVILLVSAVPFLLRNGQVG